MPGEQAEPRIFLSFAGVDRPAAKCLRESLLALGAAPFLDEYDIELGENIVTAIDNALVGSSFLVLLWSHNTIGNEYVRAEYSVALTSTLDGQTPFLFVVKLDDAALPLTLAPRKYLTFTGDWDGVANALLTAWRQDRSVGRPVRPAPFPKADPAAAISVCVLNDDLSIARVVPVDPAATGRQLMTTVRAALGLKDAVTEFAGQAGARFHYRLEHDAEQIVDNAPITAMGITDGSKVTLRVIIEWFGPDKTILTDTFRSHEARRAAVREQLLTLAFGHLRTGA